MIRVAIVENEKAARESLARLVESTPDFQCAGIYTNAEETFQGLAGQSPEVVLMNSQLPKISGSECADRLKQLLPSVQIVMVSECEDTEHILAALRAGACGYLPKRCTPEDLVAAIREAHLGGVPMPREIARKVIDALRRPMATTTEVEDLRPSEKKILELLSLGLANKEIAVRLGLAAGTVRWHLENIYRKLHINSRTEAILKFRATKHTP